ncbi:MAG: response regulator [SAR202 cluster bacterium]|nr:response regulator [SAR202 cluster bacterium]
MRNGTIMLDCSAPPYWLCSRGLTRGRVDGSHSGGRRQRGPAPCSHHHPGGRGYDVIEGSDGAEVVSEALEHRPGLILLDVAMPRVDGFEALRRIKSEPRLRIPRQSW